MDVLAVVYVWTVAGMRPVSEATPATGATQYIERSEAERLLEAAHSRGFQQGYSQGIAVK